MATLGQTIHEARRAQKKTLHNVSEQVGVSPALLSLTEQDKHIPPKALIVRLAEVLKGDADQWCGLAGKVTPNAEATLAEVAKDNPIFFRSMLKRKGSRQ
jgi:transcriptional regulator with XRE-family HTH domain